MTIDAFRGSRLVSALLAIACAGCGGSGSQSVGPSRSPAPSTAAPAPDRSTPAAAAKPGTAAPASTSRGPNILGEPFAPRQIPDPQQGGLLVGVVSAPAAWRFDSKVVWNYANSSNPVTIAMSVENPANEEAVFAFPNASFFDLQPMTMPGYYRPGQNYGGLIYAQPAAPIDTLAGFIRQVRGNAPHLRFVGSKDLPELPAALRMAASPNQRGVGVKVTYDRNGVPVEEEFYAVHDLVRVPYDGPQGRTYQINWGLMSPHSFRARAGTLDARRPVFSAIAKSFRPNPAWTARLTAINAYLQREFNRQLQAGYDQIAAAAALSRQISANNDAILASIDRQLQASRTSASSSGGGTRSETEKFDDYVRGVETTEDPYYGTSQHSINEQFHWTDGYGNYRNSNDVTYDPNRSEVGNWQLMRAAR